MDIPSEQRNYSGIEHGSRRMYGTVTDKYLILHHKPRIVPLCVPWGTYKLKQCNRSLNRSKAAWLQLRTHLFHWPCLAHLGFVDVCVCIFSLGMTVTVSQGQGRAWCFGWQHSTWRFGLGEMWEAQWQHSSLVRTGTARAAQQIETIEKSGFVKSLSGKDLWRQIQESSVQSGLLSAPSPKAVVTAKVQPWISAHWFPPGVVSCTPRRGKGAGFVLPGNLHWAQIVSCETTSMSEQCKLTHRTSQES